MVMSKKILSHREIYCFHGLVPRRYYLVQKTINTNSRIHEVRYFFVKSPASPYIKIRCLMALARAQAHELAGGRPFTSWTLLDLRAYSHRILRWLRDISVKCNPRPGDPVSFGTLRGCALARAQAPVAYMSRIASYTKLCRVLLQCS